MFKIICFHNPDEAYGFLSNWYMSDFTDKNGVKFSSMEQYMMYRKAELFGDSASTKKIMATQNVAQIKAFGRLVSGFDEKKWDKNKYDIVKSGVTLKFSQNDILRKKLLDCGECIFAECAVNDRIWGIGLSMTDPDRPNTAKWRGQNLLGRAITEVRDELKETGDKQ